MSLYMETTQIEAEETVAQIQRILGRYGASAVMTEYDAGAVSAVSFRINNNGKDIPFRLPCRDAAIYKVLASKVKRWRPDTEGQLKTQAKRVAWRQILRWIEAQMALVETHMVKIQEVFLPYVQVDLKGQTLFEKLEANKFIGLEDKRV